MARAFILDVLKKLGATSGVEICFLVKKDGDIVATAGEDVFVELETFGIMSATIFGAANTANEQMDKEKPSRVVIRSDDGDTVIKEVDDNHLLVIRTRGSENFDIALKNLKKTVEHLRSEMRG